MKEWLGHAFQILWVWLAICLFMICALDALEYEATGECRDCILFTYMDMTNGRD